jgi:hypothetical protein
MAKSQEIAQIEEIYKGLTSVDGIVNKLSDSYLKLVKTIDDGTKSTKDNATSLENLVNAQKQTTDESKKQDALDKQLAASEKQLIQLEDGRVKQLIANKIAIQEKNKALKDQTAWEKAVAGSIEKATAQNKLLYAEQRKVNLETAEGVKRNKEINAQINKNTDFISANSSELVKHRINVGNYPETTKVAVDGFGDLTSAVGGTTGAIGTAIGSFATAGGAAGVFTAVLGTVAATWKRIQENIELYLTSADKLKFGFAGYEKDAEKARLDARRRAMGQVNTGQSSLTEANRILEYSGSTEAQKEQAKLMKEQATSMIEQGRAFRDQVMGIQDKITWTLAYNKLLQEDEAISDEKLAKETEWEALEASLIKQRAIVSDSESTSAQKKQAAIDADIIANKLVKEKTDFIDKQIANITAMSEMTFTQEVVEDQLNGLLREKNTIQKEYYSDQVKINKLEKASEKDTNKANDDKKKSLQEDIKLEELMNQYTNEYFEDEKKRNKEAEKAADDKWNSEVDFQRQLFKSNREAAKTEYDAKQEEAKELKKLQEDLEKDILETKKEFLNEAMDSLFTINENANNSKIDQLEEQKDKELDNEKLTADQKKEINDKYEKQENAIKKRQKIANKLESAIEVGIKTARTVFELQAEAAILLSNPITAALAPMALAQIPWVLGMSALSLASIAAYKKGTLNAKDKFIAGEAGRELMFLKSGDVGIVEKPTYFEGSKFKGAKIFSNPETEKMIGMTDRKIGGYQITDERLLNKMDEVKKAILNKPVAIFDKENRVIGQATSHSQTIYLNKLLHRN